MDEERRPEGPQSPRPEQAGGAPQTPPPGQAPPHRYGGPVPPGGWQQPIPQAPPVPSAALASWGSRAAAILIDALILLVPFGALFAVFVVGIVISDGDGGFALFVVGASLTTLLLVVVLFLYAPLLMMRQGQRNGQTIGKQLVGIRVIRDSGQPFTFGHAALREVVLKALAVGIAASIIPILPYLLNYLWPLWDDENRALHDMAASSHVVRA